MSSRNCNVYFNKSAFFKFSDKIYCNICFKALVRYIYCMFVVSNHFQRGCAKLILSLLPFWRLESTLYIFCIIEALKLVW